MSILLELADKPYNFEVRDQGDDESEYEFSSENETFDVLCDYENNTLSIEFKMQSVNSWELSGTGNEFRVFATIAAILKHAIAYYGPNCVEFASDTTEPSRVKLYAAFARQFPKRFTDYVPYRDQTAPAGYANKSFRTFTFMRKDLVLD